jgi:O-antigen/teichoic acid export membrane protein
MWIRLFKSNIAYAIGSTANSLALFLLLPFLVNALGQEEYGVWSLSEVTILFLTMFILVGMDIGFMREYWFLDNEKERNNLGGTILMGILSWGLILCLLLGAGYWIWSRINPASIPAYFSSSTFALILAIGLAEAMIGYVLNVFRIRELANIFVIISTSRMLLFLILTLLGIWQIGGVEGGLTGRLIADGIILIISLVLVSKWVSLKFNSRYLVKVARYGIPLLPANVASYILIASDRYILNGYASLETVAIYSFTYKIANIMEILIIRPFALDWAARRFKIATSENAGRKYAGVLLGYLFITSLAGLAILAVAPIIYRLIAPATYWAGLQVLPVLLLAIFFYGLNYPLNIGIVVKDKTHYAALVGIVCAFICLGLEFILIPKYGMMGAAWSTVISYALWAAGMAYFSLKVYPIHYPLRLVALIGAGALFGYWGVAGIFQRNPGVISDYILSGIQLAWLALVFGVTGYLLLRAIRRSIPSGTIKL